MRSGGDGSGFILANPLGCAVGGGDRSATVREHPPSPPRGATLSPIGLAYYEGLGECDRSDAAGWMRSLQCGWADTIRPYKFHKLSIIVGAQRLRPQRLHPSPTKKRTAAEIWGSGALGFMRGLDYLGLVQPLIR